MVLIEDKTMKQYELWSYHVWGNAEDGYEINDRDCYCRSVEVETTPHTYNKGTDKEFSDDLPANGQIMAALKLCGYLVHSCRLDMLEIDGDGESIYITESADGRPLCELLPHERD
jgi:hypothetical protein